MDGTRGELFALVAMGLEYAGVAWIVIAAVIATVTAVRRLSRHEERDAIYGTYRRQLSRGILLGLEFLVGADIVASIAVEPTMQSVAVLGAIVLIRTVLSFTLETEISGCWPWQRGQSGAD